MYSSLRRILPQWQASVLASPQTTDSQRAPDPTRRTGKPSSSLRLEAFDRYHLDAYCLSFVSSASRGAGWSIGNYRPGSILWPANPIAKNITWSRTPSCDENHYGYTSLV